jgi:hypothetical protein
MTVVGLTNPRLAVRVDVSFGLVLALAGASVGRPHLFERLKRCRSEITILYVPRHADLACIRIVDDIDFARGGSD